MKILVDADACPVKDEVAALAREHNIEVLMVASVNHSLSAYPGCRVMVVDDYPESADLALISQAEPGDVVVTADHGLVALALAKKCHAISYRGKVYRPEEVDNLLNSRYLTRRLRRGGVKIKGPPAFKARDREQFVDSLSFLLRQGTKR